MLLAQDKIFLGLVLPLTLLTAIALPDLAVVAVLVAHTLISVRLVSSGCVVIKSIGYGVASAPLLYILEAVGAVLEANDNAVGGKVSTH